MRETIHTSTDTLDRYEQAFGPDSSQLFVDGATTLDARLLTVDAPVVSGEVVEHPSVVSGISQPERSHDENLRARGTEERELSANERLEAIINTAKSGFVPSSPEAAERAARKLQLLNETVQGNIQHGTAKGKEVTPELAEELNTLAAKGVGNWLTGGEKKADKPEAVSEYVPKHRATVAAGAIEAAQPYKSIEAPKTTQPKTEVLDMPIGYGEKDWNALATDEQRRTAVKLWQGLSPEARAEQIALRDPASEQEMSKPVRGMTDEARAEYFKNASKLEVPVSNFDQDVLQARVKHIFAKGSKKLAQIYTTVGNKIVNPFDHDFNEAQQRRAAAVITYGAAAVAVAKLYGTINGLYAGSGGGEGVLQAATSHATATRVGLTHQDIAPHATIHHEAFDTVKLKPGDELWNIEEARHPRMSEAHIRERVQQDLLLNHETWKSAAEDLKAGENAKVTRK
jgi:hypothetical protein